jgi:hypothetical protein
MDRYILLYYALKALVSLNEKLDKQLNSVATDNNLARIEMLKVAVKSSSKNRIEILEELDLLGLALMGSPIVPDEIKKIAKEQNKGV